MPSDNLNPSSAPREPEAPSEQALLEALSDAADGFEEVAWTRSSRTLMLWLMEHLPRLLASSDRIAALEVDNMRTRDDARRATAEITALEAENARLAADERRLDWLEVGGVSVYRELMTTQKEATLRYSDATLNAGFLETLITAPTIRAAIDRAAVVTAGPEPLAASRPADGAELEGDAL